MNSGSTIVMTPKGQQNPPAPSFPQGLAAPAETHPGAGFVWWAAWLQIIAFTVTTSRAPGSAWGVGGDRRGRTEITLRLLPVHRPRETRVGSRTRGYSNNANRIHKNPNKEKQVLWGSPGTEQGRQRPAGENEGKNRPRLPACSWAWWPAAGTRAAGTASGGVTGVKDDESRFAVTAGHRGTSRHGI